MFAQDVPCARFQQSRSNRFFFYSPRRDPPLHPSLPAQQNNSKFCIMMTVRTLLLLVVVGLCAGCTFAANLKAGRPTGRRGRKQNQLNKQVEELQVEELTSSQKAARVNCAGSWSAWSSCAAGSQTRVYNVTTMASGGGSAAIGPPSNTASTRAPTARLPPSP